MCEFNKTPSSYQRHALMIYSGMSVTHIPWERLLCVTLNIPQLYTYTEHGCVVYAISCRARSNPHDGTICVVHRESLNRGPHCGGTYGQSTHVDNRRHPTVLTSEVSVWDLWTPFSFLSFEQIMVLSIHVPASHPS